MTTAQALLDRLHVHDVVLRYARAVDDRDLPGVAACFLPDAAYEGSLARGTVETALRSLGDAMARYDATMHLMGAWTVTVDGDRAESRTHCVAYHVLKPASAGRHTTVGVTYRDTMVRDAAGWRIAARRVDARWRRETVGEIAHA
jgi:3-phenylpropionate/cinnamic acid dioxygenase small subunit